MRLRYEATVPPEVRVSSVWKGRRLLGWLDEGEHGYRAKCHCCHRLVGTWMETQDVALVALERHVNPQQALEVA